MKLDLNPAIEPPPGGRVVAINALAVDRRRTWSEAVMLATTTGDLSEDETEHQRKVLMCGNQFSKPGAGFKVSKGLTYLVNFFNPRPDLLDVFQWMMVNDCENRSPRVVFSIAENWPNLDVDLDVAELRLTSVATCYWGESEAHGISVNWQNGRRVVTLDPGPMFRVPHVWVVCTQHKD